MIEIDKRTVFCDTKFVFRLYELYRFSRSFLMNFGFFNSLIDSENVIENLCIHFFTFFQKKSLKK